MDLSSTVREGIDNGVTLDEIRQRELIRDHAALLYTTASHTTLVGHAGLELRLEVLSSLV
jgi:hypothetical protein